MSQNAGGAAAGHWNGGVGAGVVHDPAFSVAQHLTRLFICAGEQDHIEAVVIMVPLMNACWNQYTECGSLNALPMKFALTRQRKKNTAECNYDEMLAWNKNITKTQYSA